MRTLVAGALSAPTLFLFVLLAGSPQTDPALKRVDGVLLELPFPADTFRVMTRTIFGRAGDPWKHSVEIIRIVDRRGREHFTDSLRHVFSPDGYLNGQIELEALAIRWPAGIAGVRVDRHDSPSYPPPWTGPCRYFIQRGGTIVPVTPWCDACEEPDSGGMVHFTVWVDSYFLVRIPARLRFDREEGGIDLAPQRDVASGLALLELVHRDSLDRYYPEPTYEDYRRGTAPDASGRYACRLFRRSSGAHFDSIGVAPSSTVRFGRLLGRIESSVMEGTLLVQVKPERLEVTIDGRGGFIAADDFRVLGLWQF